MSLIRRSRVVRVFLRAAFVLISTELALSIGAPWIERHAGTPGASDCEGAIVCVGDSNTFGVGAPPGRSYPDQLRALLQATGDAHAVVNVAFPGLTTRLMVDRFVRNLGAARPACVLFLGGANDLSAAHDLIDLPGHAGTVAAAAATIHQWFSRLRSYRMAVALVRVATHDTARREYGGREKTLPDPISVPGERWNAEYARARKTGLRELLGWYKVSWEFEIPERMDRFLADLRAHPDFAAARELFHLPIECCQWEADVVNGRPAAPLAVDRDAPSEVQTYAKFTAAWSLLARGEAAAARKAFEECGPLETTPWGVAFSDLMIASSRLLERDWARAHEMLAAVLARVEGLAPPVGIDYALGAAALSQLLADDTARLAGFTAAHPAWAERYDWLLCPLGHEWMVAAECVDAIKSGNPDEARARLDKARARFGHEPATLPLRWLLAHPGATLDEARRDLALEPPRISWTGERSSLLRRVSHAELKRIVSASVQRLSDLAGERGFPLIVLTYLDYEGVVQNGVLSEIATERHLPFVSFQTVYSLTEVGAEEKRRYFSPDRFHPNEAGYGLMARALLPVVREALGTK